MSIDKIKTIGIVKKAGETAPKEKTTSLIEGKVQNTRAGVQNIFGSMKVIPSYDFEKPNTALWKQWEKLFNEKFKIFADQNYNIVEETFGDSKVAKEQLNLLRCYFIDFFREIFFMTETGKAIIMPDFFKNEEKLRTNKNATFNVLYSFLIESMTGEDIGFSIFTKDIVIDYEDPQDITEDIYKEDQMIAVYSIYPLKMENVMFDELGHLILGILFIDENVRKLLLRSYEFRKKSLS